MTLSSDNEQANDDAKVDGPTHPEYEMLGHFEPRDAKRILKRLEEQHLSFEVGLQSDSVVHYLAMAP